MGRTVSAVQTIFEIHDDVAGHGDGPGEHRGPNETHDDRRAQVGAQAVVERTEQENEDDK